MRRAARTVVVGLGLLASIAAHGADTAPGDDALRGILKARVDARRAVGLVAGTTDASGRHIAAAGTLVVGGSTPVDGASLFEIGSLTKLFTTLLLADMVVRGEVALEDPVRKFLPATVKVPKFAGNDITLGQLASHASGLPRMPKSLHSRDENNPYADYTVANLYEDLAAMPDAQQLAPEEQRYSNLGVALLGHALALRSGHDYEALLRERVLLPLGLRDVAIKLDAAAKARFAMPHHATLVPSTPWDLPVFAAAGALHASAEDLLAFAEAELGLKATPLAAAIRLQQKPVDATHALGWLLQGDHVLMHLGATGGTVSFIALDTRAKRAVVVMGNSANAIVDIGNHLFDPSLPLQAVHDVKPLADPASFDAFVGTYRLAPTFAIAVTREGGRYFVQATNQPRLEILPMGGDAFFLKQVQATVTFVRDGEGRVTHLLLDQNQRVQRANRVAP